MESIKIMQSISKRNSEEWEARRALILFRIVGTIWSSLFKKNEFKWEQMERSAITMIKWGVNLSYEKKLKWLYIRTYLFSLENEDGSTLSIFISKTKG